MLNKFKHSKAEQTTLASKLPSSQLNYPQQHNRRKRHVLSHLYLSLKSQTICVIWRKRRQFHGRTSMFCARAVICFYCLDRLRIIGGHLNLAAEEKAPKRNVGVVWSTNKNGRGGPLMDLVDDLNPGT
ncbi:hypothetical protein HID58_056997 [Brassica napus]|uniref:Uncharacterized protein n=1 Tax=Brassica napus TaxID=3708 RepID=A0ABQ8AQ22_BRANA|nr:hypothetical protein HID58_056997 [Brassica napus]